jgi:hypothetical protein
MLVTDLKEALIHSSLAHPAHINQLLQAVESTLAFSSASDPRINDWHSSRPNATFLEGFHVDFRGSLNSKFSAAAGYEWSPYLGSSLLSARARSIGRLSTPEIRGRIAEGLGFPGEALYSGGSDVVLETMALGACLQLLAGGSKLIHGEGKQFGQDKVLSALKSLKVKDKNRVVVEVGVSRLCGYRYTNVVIIECAVHYTPCASGADGGPGN